MDAVITLVKQGVTQAEVDTVVALAKNKGWAVEWSIKGTG